MIILKRIIERERGWDCMNCIDPAQEKYNWRVFVNRAMNFLVP
jgi:hypothetical protein